MSSTITLANTITWAKSFINNIDPTLQTGTEPAITSANLVKQIMLQPPFDWIWNRSVTGFFCNSGSPDYWVTFWTALTAYGAGNNLIDSNGNSQVSTTGGTTGNSQPTWNTNVGGTTNDGTVVWTNKGSIPNASSAFNFGFIETVSVQDITQSPAKWFELNPNMCLGLDSTQARPREISPQLMDAAGEVRFRLMPVPDVAYPVAITFQQKPALFTSTSSTWAPIPDEYAYIYNWGFLSLMYMYNDDPRWQVANQKFVAGLLGAQQGLTETERNIFLNNWEALSGQQNQNVVKMQQGNQARGI